MATENLLNTVDKVCPQVTHTKEQIGLIGLIDVESRESSYRIGIGQLNHLQCLYIGTKSVDHIEM